MGKIEDEKKLEEQAEPVKKKRGRPKAAEKIAEESDKKLETLEENKENKTEEKKVTLEQGNEEEEMIKNILEQNVTNLKKIAK